jgi:aryl-alcohol dehydrogenase-like predicted oxidoreductase
MEHRRLGSSDLQVSIVGLGCNNFGKPLGLEASRVVIDRALDRGINFFDTADRYGGLGGSETVIGEVLGARRKDIVLATKFGGQMDTEGKEKGASRRYIFRAVEASLRRLKTDWIDLYQLHFDDPETPLEETLTALGDLMAAGKVRYIGCSNLTAERLREAGIAAAKAETPGFCSVQDEYSLLVRKAETELLPTVTKLGMGFVPYFPLASGLLTGKYRPDADAPAGTRMADWPQLAQRFLTLRNLRKMAALQAYADEIGRPLLELAFAWLAAKPWVSSIIAGTTKPEQIDANVAAAEARLSDAEIARLDAITAG